MWSANAEAEHESGLPLKLDSGSVQQGTKHDCNSDITCGFRGVNLRDEIGPPEMVVPARASEVIENGWSEAAKLKRSSGRVEDVHRFSRVARAWSFWYCGLYELMANVGIENPTLSRSILV